MNTVWWCLEHDASFQREPDPDEPKYPCWAWFAEVDILEENCRPVLKQLIGVLVVPDV